MFLKRKQIGRESAQPGMRRTVPMPTLNVTNFAALQAGPQGY
jgi:hypothetical protein